MSQQNMLGTFLKLKESSTKCRWMHILELRFHSSELPPRTSLLFFLSQQARATAGQHIRLMGHSVQTLKKQQPPKPNYKRKKNKQ